MRLSLNDQVWGGKPPCKSKFNFKIKWTILQTVRLLMMCHMVPILKYAYYQWWNATKYIYSSSTVTVHFHSTECWRQILDFFSITFFSYQVLCRLQAAFMCIFEFICFISNLIKIKQQHPMITNVLWPRVYSACKHLYNLLSLVLLRWKCSCICLKLYIKYRTLVTSYFTPLRIL